LAVEGLGTRRRADLMFEDLEEARYVLVFDVQRSHDVVRRAEFHRPFGCARRARSRRDRLVRNARGGC
jgi:hypothetical protein